MPYTKSQATAGVGTIFEIGGGTAGAFLILDEAVELTQSGNTNPTDDITNLQSTAKEFLATLTDPGTYSFMLNRVPGNTAAGQAAYLASFQNQTTLPYRITFPKGGSQTTVGDRLTFNALAETNNFAAISPTKAIKYNASIKVSGGFTFVPGT